MNDNYVCMLRNFRDEEMKVFLFIKNCNRVP